MEHGQHGAESIGAVLSGIAQTLRDVSDKLDAVAARVGEEGADEGSLLARLAKVEAWAFRTEQDVARLDTRLGAVESNAGLAGVQPHPAGVQPRPTGVQPRPVAGQPPAHPAESAPPRSVDAIPPRAMDTSVETTAPAGRADIGTRPEPPTRAERRELAARAEQELPTRGESSLPVRDKSGAPARERLLPRAAANRGDRPEPQVADSAEIPTPAPPATQATTAPPELSTERRMPAVPPALHDWVEPSSATTTHESRAETPPVDTFTPRYETVPVPDAGRLGTDYGHGADRLDSPTSPNGRIDRSPAERNGHTPSGLTAPPETNGAHRPTIEDNAHVDKLQAMLDELKRNPNGPFGRPLGEMPA